jgi:hypothetical protein
MLAQMEAELQQRKIENKLAQYKPYDRQREFHEAGATRRERLLMAGNQLGKTLAGAMETAIHATGRYPSWWQGKRFDKPNHFLGRRHDGRDGSRYSATYVDRAARAGRY